MPHSPSTPTRRRRSSGHSISHSASSSFMMNGPGTPRPLHSRKSSMQSQHSPATLFTPGAFDRNVELGIAEDISGAEGAASGLGSLADELAEEEWDEDGEYFEGETGVGTAQGTGSNGLNGHAGNIRETPTPSPTTPASKRRRNRRRSTRSSASMFSNESDIEESEIISPELERQIAEIEQFANQAFSSHTDKSSEVFLRVEKEMRDLSSQAQVENYTSRLTNSLNSLSTSLTTQSRLLATLTQPYTSPFTLPPSSEFLDDILPLLDALITSLPPPPTTPLPLLNNLQTSTAELISIVSLLHESVQVGKQTTNQASRRLRSVRDIVDTLQRETREAEEAKRWLVREGWEGKLKERQAARVCGEVIGGFEDVCEGWRRRLWGGAAIA